MLTQLPAPLHQYIPCSLYKLLTTTHITSQRADMQIVWGFWAAIVFSPSPGLWGERKENLSLQLLFKDTQLFFVSVVRLFFFFSFKMHIFFPVITTLKTCICCAPCKYLLLCWEGHCNWPNSALSSLCPRIAGNIRQNCWAAGMPWPVSWEALGSPRLVTPPPFTTPSVYFCGVSV